MNTMTIDFILITEDRLSIAVAKKMVRAVNENTDRYLKIENAWRWDKYRIKKRAASINKAARGYRYFILTDQDTNNRCPPNAIKEIPEHLHPNLLYRFATMEIESWVLAHREAIAQFLSAPVEKIPDITDKIDKPKEYLVGLARKFSPNKIRKKLIPSNPSISQVGSDYNYALIKFVNEHWNPNIAAQHSPSLQRALTRLEEFATTPSSEKSP